MSTHIKLLSHQVQHVKNILQVLLEERSLVCMDTSDRGLGKTFTGSYLASLFQKSYGWNIAVIAPNYQCVNQTNGWNDLAEKNGTEIAWTITYSSLIGRNGKCKHGYLTSSKDDKTAYKATDKFKKLCQDGLFLILDECHKGTRKTRTHWACAELVRTCYKYGKTCRILLISNTPGDKLEHCIQLVRLMGFVRSKRLVQYDPSSREFRYHDLGLGELLDSTIKFTGDPYIEQRYMEHLRAGSAKRICLNIYKDILGPRITTAMHRPQMDTELIAANAFLHSDPESIKLLSTGIKLLSGAVGWDGTGVADKSEWNMGAISAGLKLIERGKLRSIARFVQTSIRKNPKRKFVIAVGARCTEHQTMLRDMICIKGLGYESFRALYQCWKRNPHFNRISRDVFRLIVAQAESKAHIMNGRTKNQDRVKIMDTFQADSNDCNVLIVSPGVGSEAISLHDKHGGRPRTLIQVPDHFFSRLVQGSGRIYRIGVKSDATVLMIYSKEADVETSVLDCMSRKTSVAKSLLAQGQQQIFPGNFPYWVEGKEDDRLNFMLMNSLGMRKLNKSIE